MAVKGREEAIFLSPNKVGVRLTHSNTLYEIKMGKGDHSDVVEVLYERETLTKFAFVNVIADSTNGI